MTHLEIERQFLIQGELPALTQGKKIIQAYLFMAEGKEMRIRMINRSCKLTIKMGAAGISREEYEYTIPVKEGQRLIQIGADRPPVEKIRYTWPEDHLLWEIDVFQGENEGLILAEIELTHPDQAFSKPSWVGEEVTYDKRYYNVSLYQNPYKTWNR